MRASFRKFASWASNVFGSSWAFSIALCVVILWGVTGPMFHFSNTWQLVINTGTTIVTFLMVFLIQNTQNRYSEATNLKLDELIRSVKEARDSMLNLEDLSESDLKRLHKQFQELSEKGGNKYGDLTEQILRELKERRPEEKTPH